MIEGINSKSSNCSPRLAKRYLPFAVVLTYRPEIAGRTGSVAPVTTKTDRTRFTTIVVTLAVLTFLLAIHHTPVVIGRFEASTAHLGHHHFFFHYFDTFTDIL